jgi:hypothetical protein
MRLGVRDPADILRWAGEQNARRLDEFRYRLIHGREFVSFRMVPRYAIQIGTSDIIVVAHVQPGRRQRLAAGIGALRRSCERLAATTVAALGRRAARPAPAPMAELYRFESRRAAVPSRF